MLITDENKISLNTKSIVKVICDYCGQKKEITYNNYMRSIKDAGKYACKKCVGFKCSEVTIDIRRKGYMERLLKLCNDDGYLLLSDENDIQNNQSYIKYCCPEHGTHTMRICNFLSGKRCPDCAKNHRSEIFRNSIENIVSEITACGGKLLNPNEYTNNRTKNLRIICPSCDREFLTSYVLFTQHGGQLCPDCSKTKSNGEERIKKFLDNNSIRYEQQYWFHDCRDVNPLPFDFYIPDYNTIIEFDGRQHFEETDYFSYGLAKTKLHDKIKNDYCMMNGIKLVRIPYTQINQIHKILNEIFT